MVIPKTRLSFARRIATLTPLARAKEGGAELLVRTVLHIWQKSKFSSLACRAPHGSKQFLETPEVQGFAEWLATQEFNESAYWLATAYAMWVTEAVRSERALYFTPPRLADRVIDDLVLRGADLASGRWHDPACGGAAFLVPVAQRMRLVLEAQGLGPAGVLARIQRNLSGNDLDPVLLFVSDQFLRMALFDLIDVGGGDLKFQLTQANGLSPHFGGAQPPDVVICNPPYRKLKAAEVAGYLPMYAVVIQGQPNIYGLFIIRCLQLVKTDGLVGLLTPTSFLSGQYFSKLRTELLTNSDLLQIDMLSDRVAMFLGVQQETVVTVLKTRPPKKMAPTSTEVFVLTPEGKFENVGRCLLPASGKPWPIPRAAGDATLLLRAAESSSRLSSFGYVAKVGHLVGYRDARPMYKKHPLRARPGSVLPIVWATDITPDGKFQHDRPHKLVRTKRYVRVSGDGVGVVKPPAVLMQRLTSSNQRSRLIATVVPETWAEGQGGFVCENHVIALLPTSASAASSGILAKLLNSAAVNRIFRAISGASNVAISELNELPLPAPTALAEALKHTDSFDEAVLRAYEAAAS